MNVSTQDLVLIIGQKEVQIAVLQAELVAVNKKLQELEAVKAGEFIDDKV